MSRPTLKVADVFRRHGEAYRDRNAGHLSRGQMKVMGAVEACRTAILGGHIERCESAACGFTRVAYNSCLMGKICNGELASSDHARMPHTQQISGDCLPFSSPLPRRLPGSLQLATNGQ